MVVASVLVRDLVGSDGFYDPLVEIDVDVDVDIMHGSPKFQPLDFCKPL